MKICRAHYESNLS